MFFWSLDDKLFRGYNTMQLHVYIGTKKWMFSLIIFHVNILWRGSNQLVEVLDYHGNCLVQASCLSQCLSIGTPVYGLCWAPDSDHILYTSGRQLVIKPLQAAAKPLQVSMHNTESLKQGLNCFDFEG